MPPILTRIVSGTPLHEIGWGLFVVPGVKNSQKMQENPQMRVLLYFDLAIGLVVVIEGRVLNSFSQLFNIL